MTPYKNCIPVLFLISVFSFFGHVYAQRASFGQACNQTTRCDSRASLSCEDNMCKCLIPNKMVYDEAQAKCVTMAGEKCIIYSTSSESETKKFREELKCVSNSVCSTEGYCTCTSGYFENFDGACERKHEYGESCSRDSNCRENVNLVCSDKGTCDCKSLTGYHPGLQKCVGRVGTLCKEFSECVPNAECPPQEYESTRSWDSRSGKYYYPKIPYSNETCQCDLGNTATGDGYCYAKYGHSCDYNIPSKRCLPGLVCREGYCSCPSHPFEYINPSKNKCLGVVGSTCTSSDSCVKHSECISSSEKGATCRCKSGFIEVVGRCEIAFGEKCGSTVLDGLDCDQLAPLYCIDGQCKCGYLEYYDKSLQLCRGLNGAICKLGPGREYFCTEGSTCIKFRGITKPVGRCRCQPPFSGTSEGKCEKNVSANVEITTQELNTATPTTEEEVESTTLDSSP